MRRSRGVGALASVVVGLASLDAGAVEYAIEAVPDNGSGSWAWDLNDSGVVAGERDSGTAWQPTLWTDGVPETLPGAGDPDGAGSAMHVDEAGVAVGWGMDAAGVLQLLRWDGGPTPDVLSIPGLSQCLPYSASEFGNLGLTCRQNNTNWALRVLTSAGVRVVPTPIVSSGFPWPAIHGMTEDARYLVGAAHTLPNRYVPMAWAFGGTSYSAGTVLPLPWGITNSGRAADIAQGLQYTMAVGCARDLSGVPRPMYWRRGQIASWSGTMLNWPVNPAWVSLQALDGVCAEAVNSRMVVGSATDPQTGLTAWYSAMGSLGIITTSGPLTSLMAPGHGWAELETATALTDGGRILGTGRLNGQERHYVATPITAALALNGAVPGIAGVANTMTVSHAPQNSYVLFYRGTPGGTTHHPGCPPENVMSIGDPQLIGIGVTNANGVATFTDIVPANEAGTIRTVQALDHLECNLSNVHSVVLD